MTTPTWPPWARCTRCGKRWDEHHYRHRFESSMIKVDPWASVEVLVHFGRWVLQHSFEGLSIDGGDAQREALRRGLLVEVPGGYDPEKHGEQDAEPGEVWYEFGGPLKFRRGDSDKGVT